MYEEDGKFNRKKFEAEQLDLLAHLAARQGGEIETHYANKTILVRSDKTYDVLKRKDAVLEPVVEPSGTPANRQLGPKT